MLNVMFCIFYLHVPDFSYSNAYLLCFVNVVSFFIIWGGQTDEEKYLASINCGGSEDKF